MGKKVLLVRPRVWRLFKLWCNVNGVNTYRTLESIILDFLIEKGEEV